MYSTTFSYQTVLSAARQQLVLLHAISDAGTDPRGGLLGSDETSPQPGASSNQRYEMTVDNKLNLSGKFYEQRRARCYEKTRYADISPPPHTHVNKPAVRAKFEVNRG